MRALCILALAALLTGCNHAPTFPAPSANELTLYRAAFTSILKEANHPFNIADTTDPFEPETRGDDHCLKDLEIPTTPTHTRHKLPPETFAGLPVHLIDPGTRNFKQAVKQGVLYFSEIAYNPAHTRAAFSYGFYCGGLCGGGAVVIFDLNHGQWTQSATRCNEWIS